MERTVLYDCHSEQVKALIEEHNKAVDFMRVVAGDDPRLKQLLPSRIATTPNRRMSK